MTVFVGLAIGLILAGLAMAWLSGGMRSPGLISIVYWVGVILVVIGLILLVTPVLIWLNNQIRAMLAS